MFYTATNSSFTPVPTYYSASVTGTYDVGAASRAHRDLINAVKRDPLNAAAAQHTFVERLRALQSGLQTNWTAHALQNLGSQSPFHCTPTATQGMHLFPWLQPYFQPVQQYCSPLMTQFQRPLNYVCVPIHKALRRSFRQFM